MDHLKKLSDKIRRGDASEDEIDEFGDFVESVAREEIAYAKANLQNEDLSEENATTWARIGKFQQRDRRPLFQRRPLRWAVFGLIACLPFIGIYMYGLTKISAPHPLSTSIKFIGPNHVKLPDGTTVELNEATTLWYEPTFSKERNVFLEGEAYFDVVHDTRRPFRVQAGGTTTTVLGTAFDVKARKGQENVTVTVTRGKVSVETQDTPAVIVTPGQQLTYSPDARTTETKETNAERLLQWKDAHVIFEDVPLRDVAKRLSEKYSTKISFEKGSVQDCLVNLHFVRGEGLHEMLDLIMKLYDSEYKTIDGTVIISGGTSCSVEIK